MRLLFYRWRQEKMTHPLPPLGRGRVTLCLTVVYRITMAFVSPQLLHCIGKRAVFQPHHERDHIASRPAGMAFEKLFAHMQHQRRMMIVVKRTQHLVINTCLLKASITCGHPFDRVGGFQLFDIHGKLFFL